MDKGEKKDRCGFNVSLLVAQTGADPQLAGWGCGLLLLIRAGTEKCLGVRMVRGEHCSTYRKWDQRARKAVLPQSWGQDWGIGTSETEVEERSAAVYQVICCL